MRKSKIIILSVLALMLLVAASLWEGYRRKHSMAPAPEITIGDSSSAQHVLIATQGSAFKNAFVHAILARLTTRPVFIRVIDISALPDVRESEWTAIIVMHTWEFGKPSPAARAFIEHVQDRHRLIVITTSGSGRERIPGIDAVSAASVVRDVPEYMAEIAPRIDALLREANPANAPP